MKRCMYLLILVGLVVSLGACSNIREIAKQNDTELATYLGVTALSPDCKAGIAQCDADLSADPINMRNITAVIKNADVNSADYKSCYAGIAWLNYVEKKVEGTIRTAIKKLTELGVIVP